MTQRFTKKDLLEHLKGMQTDLSQVPLRTLLQDHPVACIDGRNTESIVGAPGGNAGLFALLLAAIEQTSGKAIPLSRIQSLFEAYLNHFGHFYLHTDTLALANLQTSMARQPDLAPYADRLDTPEDTSTFLLNTPVAIRASLLHLLVQPENMGCGHLRLMSEHAPEYGIRAELVSGMLQLFFERLWAGDPRLVFDMLEGIHEEEAIVNVIVPAEPGEPPHLMTTYPLYDDQQLFMHHPQAVSYMLKEQADFLVQSQQVPLDSPETLVEQQQKLAEKQLLRTIHYLAPDLPIFEVTLHPDSNEVTVTEHG